MFIYQLKNFKRPPATVSEVLGGVAIILNVKPKQVLVFFLPSHNMCVSIYHRTLLLNYVLYYWLLKNILRIEVKTILWCNLQYNLLFIEINLVLNCGLLFK